MQNGEALAGGREGKIFRRDDCIVRPANPWTADVHAFLRFLIDNGFDAVPHPAEITADGREIVSFVPGVVHNDSLPESILTDEVLVCVAEMLRRYHDIGAAYMPQLRGDEAWMLPARTPAEVMCHGDFAPYNMTFADGRLYGVIDFDTLHPGPRLWDIAYAVYRWVPFVAPSNPDCHAPVDGQLARLRLFADAYGMDAEMRRNLPQMMADRLGSLVAYMRGQAAQGNEDVLRNIADGHMDLYLNDIAWFEQHAGAMTEILLQAGK